MSFAFSLAETLFAMAIVSFTILSIIGLMPAAMDELRQAERRAAEARILQSLAAEYELLPWRELERFTPRGPFAFDETGLQRQAQDSNTRYLATIDMPTDSPVLLPGEGSSSPYLKQLRIRITDRVLDASALGGGASQGKARDFYVIVAKREADIPTVNATP